ncbi:MAG: HAD family phosphatase [Planctomycetia bacterium]|nr:HAD family phosphatase [Planctomycetia bacterium]
MTFKAVAFDMDGLMFDTEAIYWEAATRLLGRRGFPYTDELNRRIMGRPPQFCFQAMIAEYELPDTWQVLQQESQELFLELLPTRYAPMPGLHSLLDFLEYMHIPKAICTSSTKRIATAVLAQENMASRFDFILTAEDITHGKPSPDIYLTAAKRFRIPPNEMIVLEDSVAGCQAAHGADAFCVVVLAEHNRNLDFPLANQIVTSLALVEPLINAS